MKKTLEYLGVYFIVLFLNVLNIKVIFIWITYMDSNRDNGIIVESLLITITIAWYLLSLAFAFFTIPGWWAEGYFIAKAKYLNYEKH